MKKVGDVLTASQYHLIRDDIGIDLEIEHAIESLEKIRQDFVKEIEDLKVSLTERELILTKLKEAL